MVQGVWSEDPAAQVEATTHFRKLLSIGIYLFRCFWLFFLNSPLPLTIVLLTVERSPPIDEVIKAGVVPRFVEFLGRHDLPQLQVCVIYSSFFSCYVAFTQDAATILRLP